MMFFYDAGSTACTIYCENSTLKNQIENILSSQKLSREVIVKSY